LTIGQASRVKNKLLHKRGHPDLFICQCVGGYGGLFIELKKEKSEVYKQDGTYKKNAHLEEQIKYHEQLRKSGYKVVFGLGFEDTIIKIKDYLKGIK